MKRLAFLILISLALTACQTSVVSPTGTMSEISEVLPTPSSTPRPTEPPLPPTTIPTATPIAFDLEQLKTMTAEQKLAIAPQIANIPSDVLVTYVSSLASGTDISNTVWGEKTLTYWDRVVAYHGQVDGQEVTVFYDLESGQWAKKYESFESLSQIPADQIPDVMVLDLGGDLGDRLIRNKLQYNYDWISQPPAMTADGKQIFRDEKGYPKAVFDPINNTWLTPEQADVNVTMEKFKEMYSSYSYMGDDGKTYNADGIFKYFTEMTYPAQTESQLNGTKFKIFNPSGEISIWSSQKEAAQRQREGATVYVMNSNSDYAASLDALEVAFDQHQKGNKTIFVTVNDLGVARNQIQGVFVTGFGLKFEKLPKGNVQSVIRMPKIFKAYSASGEQLSVTITNPDLWLDELIGEDATWISINCVEGDF